MSLPKAMKRFLQEAPYDFQNITLHFAHIQNVAPPFTGEPWEQTMRDCHFTSVWGSQKQIFIGNGFPISIEMNMMTDNEYMPLDALRPAQNDQ